MEGVDNDPIFMTRDWMWIGGQQQAHKGWKEKGPRCIVDFVHLNGMASSYNHHFMIYSWGRQNMP
jgi:hypothetical protein